MSDYQKETVLEFAQKATKQGVRVFIAEKGTYGFITNQNGDRIVSFGFDLCCLVFSGNYKTNNPKQTGKGWRIEHVDLLNIPNLLKEYPPYWSVGDSKWEFTTLDQHLKMYQNSSKYKEYL